MASRATGKVDKVDDALVKMLECFNAVLERVGVLEEAFLALESLSNQRIKKLKKQVYQLLLAKEVEGYGRRKKDFQQG